MTDAVGREHHWPVSKLHPGPPARAADVAGRTPVTSQGDPHGPAARVTVGTLGPSRETQP